MDDLEFTFTIPGNCRESLKKYLDAQVNTKQDPLTKATVVERNPGCEDEESFLAMQLTNVLDQVCELHPMGDRRAKMEDAERIKKEAKEIGRITTQAQRMKAKG